MSSSPDESYLFHDILKQVSRSFYLTLAVLPSRVAKQVGLAYLFARAADTVADTGQVDRSARVMFLQQFKLQFQRERLNWDEINAVQAMMSPQQSHPGERKLLEQLESCFQIYEQLSPEDQEEIRQVLPTLISGMEMDLKVFPGDSTAHLSALQTVADLDTYIYRVAGCVGEFWTNLMCAHLPRIRRRWDREQKIRIGIRFGKGLQLTNILKDLPRDLRRGRCYIPREMLEAVGLEPKDLLDKRNMSKFSPVLQKLVGITLAHLDQGWFYTMSIPRFEVRLRLACMWPILIALRTLHLLTTCDNLLDPGQSHKISRMEVYRIVCGTTLTGGSEYMGTAYWGHFRKAVG
ncbi:phytoene/squalene synthase family protein [Candidatus Nitronereus thalassa]|uniref:Phytoene/squalene synthase family protein n=1 Tax=Candidatus Nitronereus thalassa TaxID=3020898 RepID=A0ABU3K4B6_9BACT|nr:phytoene/squalene synthase family protein [Candidatus Nitronereus thalassa]MDT7041237.1 phytoene/squalene synthase family protein [Candidatus Nitronereus thalassa]